MILKKTKLRKIAIPEVIENEIIADTDIENLSSIRPLSEQASGDLSDTIEPEETAKAIKDKEDKVTQDQDKQDKDIDDKETKDKILALSSPQLLPDRDDTAPTFLSKEEVFRYGIKDGAQTLVPERKGVLELTDMGAPKFSLSDWQLVLSEVDIIPLAGRLGETIYMPLGMTRCVLFDSAGTRVDFCNISKLTAFANSEDSADQPEVKEPKEKGHMFLYNIENEGQGWTIITLSVRNFHLAEFAGQTLPLNDEDSGLLLGPEGATLHFSHITNIIIPEA